MKNKRKLYPILPFFIACLVFFLPIALCCQPVQATSTATKRTSLTQINSIINENEEEINTLIETQKQLNMECSAAINNALENNLLVNEKDSKALQKLSSDLEKRTEKLKAAKIQQQEVQEELDAMNHTKSSKYRKLKCKIITLQNRQFKLISQLNKDMEKIMKLCTPKETGSAKT